MSEESKVESYIKRSICSEEKRKNIFENTLSPYGHKM